MIYTEAHAENCSLRPRRSLPRVDPKSPHARRSFLRPRLCSPRVHKKAPHAQLSIPRSQPKITFFNSNRSQQACVYMM